jgi:hypothetical protein
MHWLFYTAATLHHFLLQINNNLYVFCTLRVLCCMATEHVFNVPWENFACESLSRIVVFNLRYAYPREYAKTS